MLCDFRYKNKKDFYVCKLDTIVNALDRCVKDQKNVNKNQSGGDSNSRSIILKKMISEMKKYSKILNLEIKKMNCLLKT